MDTEVARNGVLSQGGTAGSNEYPKMEWASSLDIPLKASEELVSIDLKTDLPEDAADLKTLLVEESSDKEHWLTIAIAYCNEGKVSEGIKLIELALGVFEGAEKASLHTFLTWAHLRMAKAHTMTVDTREHELTQAEVHLRDAIGFDPTWIGNMLATVDLYYERGNYDKALETSDLFVKSIHAEDKRTGKLSKPNAFFILLRAKLMYQKKNYVASLKLFQELLVINPVLKPDPRIGIGMCFWQLKDYKLAIQAWERSQELDSNNKEASILVLLGKFHNALTSSDNDAQFKENYSNALADLNNVYKNSKENPVLLVLLQSYYYFKGDYKTVQDIYEQRISKLTSMTTSSILSESAFWSGRAYYALGDYKKSFAMFQESLRRDESNLLAKLGLGQTQIKNDLVEESILTFEGLYKNNENLQELNYILGLLYAGKCLAGSSHVDKSGKNGKDKVKKPTGTEMMKLLVKALQYLEKYVKLTAAKKNQLAVPRVFLVMSQLYELQSNYKPALESLEKAVTNIKFLDGDSAVPIEIINNLACLYFINGDFKKAQECLVSATQGLSDSKQQSSVEKLVIDFNVSRTMESQDKEDAIVKYKAILEEHPFHVAAKLRQLYIELGKVGADNSEEYNKLGEEVEKLVTGNEDNLEVRAFYGWYLKRVELTGRSVAETNAKETAFNRDTLVKYNSHDCYALISLANLYVTLGRDIKNSKSAKDQEKSKQSFLKAIQLYQKVLQVDPLNVFAAQGIAIMFAENKRLGPALEILRKVRDTLENEDVHVNIANCLLDMRDYIKAIETYEYVLKKFCDEGSQSVNRSRVLNLLARAWYSRGMRERSVLYFQNALQKAEASLETEKKSTFKNERFLDVLKYNVALLHFQIAETLRRTAPMHRTADDLKAAVVGLVEAISLLKELEASEGFKTVSKEELEQRIQLGETTMKSALERSVAEQETFEVEQNKKIEDARELQAKAEADEEERRRQAAEDEKAAMEKKNEEFKKLQEEARKLMEERESFMVDEKDVNDLSDVDGDFGGDEEAAAGRKSSKKKATRKRKRASNDTKDGAKTSGKEGDEDEEEDDEEIKISSGRKKKKSSLSEEFIVDSDEEEMSNGAVSDDENDKQDEVGSDHDDDNNDDEDDEGLF
ncbi:Ctr9p [Nakaseomyces bracarensis]|uniref:Ctr9p n=1 Tax=Nakaseomyces bracarensis TaxID=273131 RepID=UPI0038714AAD